MRAISLLMCVVALSVGFAIGCATPVVNQKPYASNAEYMAAQGITPTESPPPIPTPSSTPSSTPSTPARPSEALGASSPAQLEPSPGSIAYIAYLDYKHGFR
jgi:hypothetical protein